MLCGLSPSNHQNLYQAYSTAYVFLVHLWRHHTVTVILKLAGDVSASSCALLSLAKAKLQQDFTHLTHTSVLQVK